MSHDKNTKISIADLIECRFFVGWNGYCWKDDQYIDSIQDYMDNILRIIEGDNHKAPRDCKMESENVI